MRDAEIIENDGKADSHEMGVDAATPPRCPSPMPTQTIEIWTPALIAAALMRGFKGWLRGRTGAQLP
jgi:hypothetical protein